MFADGMFHQEINPAGRWAGMAVDNWGRAIDALVTLPSASCGTLTKLYAADGAPSGFQF